MADACRVPAIPGNRLQLHFPIQRDPEGKYLVPGLGCHLFAVGIERDFLAV